ncbi:MAG: 50S ribosomal protein L9 [Candidatus Fermentibacteraceae bacterium]
MKVLLIRTVRDLGKAGEVVDVAAGYARNYLFPKKLATKATKSAMKSADIYRQRAEEEERELESAASVLAEKISGVSVAFNETADENGHLYGSVSERDIAAALSEKGFDIGRRQVRLPDGHLKQVGEHEVEINLHGEISGRVKVVVDTDSPQKAPEEETESAEETATDTEPAGEKEE